jgi:hypothetical protein
MVHKPTALGIGATQFLGLETVGASFEEKDDP